MRCCCARPAPRPAGLADARAGRVGVVPRAGRAGVPRRRPRRAQARGLGRRPFGVAGFRRRRQDDRDAGERLLQSLLDGEPWWGRGSPRFRRRDRRRQADRIVCQCKQVGEAAILARLAQGGAWRNCRPSWVAARFAAPARRSWLGWRPATGSMPEERESKVRETWAGRTSWRGAGDPGGRCQFTPQDAIRRLMRRYALPRSLEAGEDKNKAAGGQPCWFQAKDGRPIS
ncbi:Uncharacterised protein [Chromobacterium violaceum]|uniref:Uncharacterized protein n=1 Tax=Chromobacterium violaceum TaxID=536 RepID=A0A447TCV7_CHRVL|nr:Uncharacterised protein [Chromobacterium violaceum]